MSSFSAPWECNGLVSSATLTKVPPHVCGHGRLIRQMTKAPAEQKSVLWCAAFYRSTSGAKVTDAARGEEEPSDKSFETAEF